ENTYQEAVMSLIDDSSRIVQRQLAASAGELPPGKRDEALTDIVNRYGDDPMVTSLVMSGLPGREFAFLEQLLEQSQQQQGTAGAARACAKNIWQSDADEHVNTLVTCISDQDKPAWQRTSLLAALEDEAPQPAAGGQSRLFELSRKPSGLLSAESGDSQLAQRISKITERLGWPGKPRTEPRPEPLSPEEKERFNIGKELFSTTCASCHQQNGQGIEGMGASLADSPWVLGKPDHLIRIILDGKDGEMFMPPHKHLSDDEIAAIATYLRQAWGHEEGPVTSSNVHEVRGASTGRDRPWTEEELRNHQH